MASKRVVSADTDEASPSPKRPRKSKSSFSSFKDRKSLHTDPTSGQKYVFGSSRGNSDATSIPAGEESDFEDDADAMAYLSSVRQEANGIPHLLVAPKIQIGPQLPDHLQKALDAGEDDENEYDHDENDADFDTYYDDPEDDAGFYQDGAYVAYTVAEDDFDASAAAEQTESAYDDQQKVSADTINKSYFEALLAQYLHLRNIVCRPPSQASRDRLSYAQKASIHPCAVETSVPKTWYQILKNTDPLPAQIALLPRETVLHMLEILLGGPFLQRGYSLSQRTSCWLWALLARLPDRGELDHTAVGCIRDLGRRAVLLGRSSAEMAALRDELGEGELDAHKLRDDANVSEDGYATEQNKISARDEVAQASTFDEDRAVVRNTAQRVANTSSVEPDSPSPPRRQASKEDENIEEGEINDDDDDGDIAMDLASVSEPVADEQASVNDDNAERDLMEEARKRLLASLNTDHDSGGQGASDMEEVKLQARINKRATLNMVLTVVGDFYGQRDLLEFREPFLGV